MGPDGAPRVVDVPAWRRGVGRIAISLPCAPSRKSRVGARQDVREVERGAGILLEQLDPPDDLFDRPRAQPSQVIAHLLGDQEDVIDDMLGPPLELGAEILALGGDAGRAGVEVALPGHIAAERDEHARSESEFLCAEQRGDHDVAPAAQTAIGAQANALAQPVRHEHLLRLGETQLPWRAGVLDRRKGRGTGASVVARDQDVVGARFGHAGRDRADTGLGDELHPDAGARVDRLQVVDELGQVFDRIDVVVGRG